MTKSDILTAVKIDGYKAFINFELSDLRPFNIIIGASNVGKTSLLEALMIAGNEELLEQVGTIFRIYPVDDSLAYGDGRAEIFSEFTFSTSGVRKLNCFGGFASPFDNPIDAKIIAIPTTPRSIQSMAQSYGSAVIKKKKKLLIEQLRHIEDRLVDLETPPQSGNQIMVDIGGLIMRPSASMGQGFNRLLDLFSRILNHESDIVLIDEFENGLHYSALETTWQGLLNVHLEMGTQFFVTSHSYESIEAAWQVFKKAGKTELLNVIRLEREPDNSISAVVIKDSTINTMMANNYEIR
jgi:predicted ATP-dependent endonuclease of OLD family